MYTWIWLILMVVFVVIEMMTVGLTSIWFAIGSLGAYLSSLLGAGTGLQIAVFVVLSVILFLLTRPLFADKLNKSRAKTNVYSLIGRSARVTERIDPDAESGSAFLDGKEWTARSASGKAIEADTICKVVAVEGVKLILEETGTVESLEA